MLYFGRQSTVCFMYDALDSMLGIFLNKSKNGYIKILTVRGVSRRPRKETFRWESPDSARLTMRVQYVMAKDLKAIVESTRVKSL